VETLQAYALPTELSGGRCRQLWNNCIYFRQSFRSGGDNARQCAGPSIVQPTAAPCRLPTPLQKVSASSDLDERKNRGWPAAVDPQAPSPARSVSSSQLRRLIRLLDMQS
jgi:hypothetical protein